MERPIIGISANQRLNTTLDDLPWTYTPAGFPNAVIAAGGTPLLLPIGDSIAAKTYISMIDKLIIIGGQNVDPSFYNEEKAAFDDDFFMERDLFEIALVKEAIRQNKPIFGICRGMQLMNVILGGTLHQNIENHWQNQPSDTTFHKIKTEEKSILRDIYGEFPAVNSLHHQSLNRLGKGLKVIAEDPRDRTIEAVISDSKAFTFLGVQWHPELLQAARKEDLTLFDFFVNHFH